MRLAIGLAGALLLHGVVFGVGLALLPREVRRPVAVAVVDVDVVPARPDPVTAAPPPVPPPAPAARPARHLRRAAPALPPAPTGAPAALMPIPAPPTVAATALALPAAGPAAGARPAAAPAPGPSLSAQPRYRTNPPPVYPIAARRLREEGLVFVRVAVAADGRATAVTVERGCGHPLLDEAALDAVRRWTFEPARAAGTPVDSLVVIPVRFSLSDGR